MPEEGLTDAFGEELGAGAEPEGVGPDHPGAMGRDVAAADRGEPQNDAGGHRGADHEPDAPQQVPARCSGVEQRHPERRAGDGQTGHDQDPAGPAVPVQMSAAQPGGELERAEQGVDGRAEHVHHQRCG